MGLYRISHYRKMKKGELVTWKFGPAGLTYIVLEVRNFHKLQGHVMCRIFGSNGKMNWINEAQLQLIKNIQ